MATARRRGGNGAWLLGICLLMMTGVIAWKTPRAQADLIDLRGGGQVQGKVVPDPKNKDRVQVWLLRGRNPLSFHKGQIVRVTRQASPLDEYVLKRAKDPSTAAAQSELGSWCDEHGLPDLAKVHFENALSLDSTLDEAHRKLGHVYREGSWLTRDDLSAAQGLVKYKGAGSPPRRRPSVRRRPRPTRRNRPGCGGSGSCGRRSSTARRIGGGRPSRS